MNHIRHGWLAFLAQVSCFACWIQIVDFFQVPFAAFCERETLIRLVTHGSTFSWTVCHAVLNVEIDRLKYLALLSAVFHRSVAWDLEDVRTGRLTEIRFLPTHVDNDDDDNDDVVVGVLRIRQSIFNSEYVIYQYSSVGFQFLLTQGAKSCYCKSRTQTWACRTARRTENNGHWVCTNSWG